MQIGARTMVRADASLSLCIKGTCCHRQKGAGERQGSLDRPRAGRPARRGTHFTLGASGVRAPLRNDHSHVTDAGDEVQNQITYCPRAPERWPGLGPKPVFLSHCLFGPFLPPALAHPASCAGQALLTPWLSRSGQGRGGPCLHGASSPWGNVAVSKGTNR